MDYLLLLALAVGAYLYLRSTKSTTFTSKSAATTSKPASTSTTAKTAAVTSNENSYSFLSKLESKSIVVFYGSQTGTAEEYAGRLAKEATQYGLKSMVADLMDYDMDDLRHFPQDKLAIFCLATYGEGEPTDNARDFHEWLLSDDRLADVEQFTNNLHYVMFGLGNKTYEHFNVMARICDKRLLELGAKRVGLRGEGDDDGNLEEDFLNWKEGMWKEVCQFFGIDPNNIKHELVRSFALRELAQSTKEMSGKFYQGEIGAVQAWNGKQK